MSKPPDRPKKERFAEFLRRLSAALPAENAVEAFDLLCAVLNDVEDTWTSIPFHPERFAIDGRMYPPQDDNKMVLPGPPRVECYRSRQHVTLIGENGAIEIRSVGAEPVVVLSKPGADGKGIGST